MGNHSPVDRGLSGAGRRRRLFGRAALAAVAAGAVGLGVGASPGSAAEWGYEQSTPAEGSSIDIFGIGASKDMSTALTTTLTVAMAGMPSDGRLVQYFYGVPRTGAPWTVGPVNTVNGPQFYIYVRGMSPDGSRVLYTAPLRSVDADVEAPIFRVDAQGGAENLTFGQRPGSGAIAASENLDALAFRSQGSDQPVYVGRAGSAPVLASVDNVGTPMTTTGLGGESSFSRQGPAAGALAGDGSSVIFTSVDGLPGDNDGGFPDVYRRVLTPGAEQTLLISDGNGSGDPDAAADTGYRWATTDHQRVFFVTAEGLEVGDTDGEQDVYVRVGTGPPLRVSQGEVVDGAPTGNGSNSDGNSESLTEWAMSSQDGNRTFFTTPERLTQDAPAGDGVKLYERDVAEGRTRFVAGPLVRADVKPDNGTPEHGSLLGIGSRDLSFRGIRLTPAGAVFMSRAPLAGADDDALAKVFVWTRNAGLAHISKPDADAPPSLTASASILPRSPMAGAVDTYPVNGGRGVSDDGSRVFFTTGQSLTAEDTDGGYSDVYVWTAGEGLSLVTPPGRAAYDAGYVNSSADGAQVYFNTSETILPGDNDPNANDVYLAILGGGSAPGKPAPDADPQVCRGEACQGPIAGPLAPPSIGSVSFAGLGDLPVLPDPVTPSVAVGKVRAVTGSVATLKVRVPDAGRISVAGASLRSASLSAPKAGSYSVRVALSSAAKRSLKRKRTLKVSARVSYRANDDQTASKTVSVTFKQPKAKPAKTRKGGR